MNKGVLIGIMFLYMILVVYIATIMGVDSDVSLIGTSFSDVENDIGFLDLIGTFFNMIRFNVDIPWALNIFLIYPPIIVIVWQIAELIRG